MLETSVVLSAVADVVAEIPLTLSEPLGLVLWGGALLALSASLRRRSERRSTVQIRQSPEFAASVDRVAPPVVRAVEG